MPKFFRFPWASTGDKTAIPDATDVAGFVSYQQGYGNDYARDPATDPLAKLIERDKMNQLFSDLTDNAQYWQTHTFPEYITAAQNGGVAYAYDIGVIVRYDDGGGYKNYQNEMAANINLPTGAGWVLKEGIAGLNAPKFLGPVTIDGNNVSPFDGKNLLINSNGLINQRGYVSGTATTIANQYTVDRWRVVTSGQNLTFSTTNGVTTFTAPADGVEQVIENLNVLGGSYVLTIGGTATATVSESADNVTYTTLTPTNGIYTVTGGKYVKVTLSSGTFSLPQFERGTIATPYGFREFGGELQACQRYYEISSDNFNNPASRIGAVSFISYSTSAINQTVVMNIKKRIAPTVVFKASQSGTIGSARNVPSASDLAIYTPLGTSSNSFLVSSATTVSGSVYEFHWSASAEL